TNSTIGATSPNSTLSISSAASLGGTFTADLNLNTSNQWTASTTFTKVLNLANASSSLNTFGTAWIPSLGTAAGTFLATDPNGKIIATSTPAIGGSGTVTSVQLATPNSTLVLGGTNPVTTSGTINGDLNLGHSNWWTAG